jgi:hypothetical protein
MFLEIIQIEVCVQKILRNKIVFEVLFQSAEVCERRRWYSLVWVFIRMLFPNPNVDIYPKCLFGVYLW